MLRNSYLNFAGELLGHQLEPGVELGLFSLDVHVQGVYVSLLGAGFPPLLLHALSGGHLAVQLALLLAHFGVCVHCVLLETCEGGEVKVWELEHHGE